MTFERELAVAGRLALEAGAVLRRHRSGGPLAVRRKAHDEVVTAADLESDALIRRGLAAAFGEDALYTEESPDSPARLASERVWIVDPLDATSTYVKGGDEYAVSIGLSVGGRAVVGVVYAPARHELFAGAESAGVTLNGAPVRLHDEADLTRARLVVSRKEWERGLRSLGSLPLAPVASMAHKLARVAAGLEDGTFSLKQRKEWGTCAGTALVTAGGGRVTSLDGRNLGFNRSDAGPPRGLVAAGPALHRALLAALGPVAASQPWTRGESR